MSEYDARGCGCCKGGVHAGPRTIANRPALSRIAYRIGTYGSFRRAMLNRIAQQPALAKWTARDETDYGVALIDMWAYLGDILTFYQERIANEAFLRTAVHRESVMRLAALLDYRPSPGAAATTYVAFFLDKGKTLEIPIGLRVQSVPGQNEKPQKFETVEAIHADAALNAVRVFGVPQPYEPFAIHSTGGPLTAPIEIDSGASIAVFDFRAMERKTITAIDAESLRWSPAVQRNGLVSLTTRAMPVGRQFALYGSNVPLTTLVHKVDGDKVTNETHTTEYKLTDLDELPLDRVVDLAPGTRVLVVRSGIDAVRMATVRAAEPKAVEMRSTGTVLLPAYSTTATILELDIRVTSNTAAAIHNGKREIYVIADDSAVWMRRRESQWQDWKSLGGQFTSVIAASGANGTRQIIASDATNRLWLHANDGWTAFSDDARDLAEAGTASGRAFVVARGPDGRASIRKQLPNGSWGAWIALDGHACDVLAATARNDGAIEVFIRRKPLNGVFTRRETAPDGPWSAWQPLGGLVKDLAAGTHQNGTVEVFGIGMDNALWRNRRVNNAWTGWSSLNGSLQSISVRRDGGGRLRVFARGTDDGFWSTVQNSVNSTIWNNWSTVPEVPTEFASGSIDADGTSCGYLVIKGALWQWRNNDVSSIGRPMFAIPDRRRISIFEVTGDALPLATRKHPQQITGSVVLVQLTSIENGRTILLDDAQKKPHTATVVSTASSDGFVQISFTPALPRALDATTAALHGNVARVTHGETVKSEVLGSGNAAARFQTFALAKKPVTFVPQAGARNGVANTLELRVDGVKWSEVETLLGRGKDERVFVTRVDENDRMTVEFGGEPGARLTTGRNNVTAKYRVGLGGEGNVRAGALANLLDRPPGLKSVTNPAPAEGGAAGESRDLIRINAPNTVRTFSRIVSLRDFEDAAREHATVAKARASWTVDDFERVVQLTVAAEGGAVLSDDALAIIAADLDAKRDVNRPMRIRSHQNVPFAVEATLQIDPAHLLENVRKAAEEALSAYFAFDARELGQAVHLSDVYAVLQRVPGVIAARITKLRKKSGGATIGDHILLPGHQIATLAAADRLITAQFTGL